MNHEHPGLSSAGTPDGADPLDRPRRRAGQPPRPFEDDFKAYPRVALDKSLAAHHIDLMMVQLGLAHIEGSERTVKTADSIDTELISCFTAIRRSNIGRYITELEKKRFLKTQRSGTALRLPVLEPEQVHPGFQTSRPRPPKGHPHSSEPPPLRLFHQRTR